MCKCEMLKLKQLRIYDYRYINKHLCNTHRSFKLLSDNEIIKVQSFNSDAHLLTKTTLSDLQDKNISPIFLAKI